MKLILYYFFYSYFRTVMAGFSDIFSAGLSIFTEQCDDKWVPRNIIGIENDFNDYIYGQEMAGDVVIAALRSYINNPSRRKPLVFDFHGWPGIGKSYAADFIVKNWFKEGEKSKFVKSYKAKIHFPRSDDSEVNKYQVTLQKDLKDTVSLCPRAMFIFDEVEKYPPHLLDAIKPYLDYNSNINGNDFRKAIFIFISNTAQELIVNITLEKWKQGIPREDLTMQDFERPLKTKAFNDEGGFYKSDLIAHHLIDYTVPFLPLEKSHVKSCVLYEIKQQASDLQPLLKNSISDIMNEFSYGPDDYDLYSTNGCKHVHAVVSTFVERNQRRTLRKTRNEL